MFDEDTRKKRKPREIIVNIENRCHTNAGVTAIISMVEIKFYLFGKYTIYI
jgi:predicted transcriptional regulator